jgi:hypothetical protein
MRMTSNMELAVQRQSDEATGKEFVSAFLAKVKRTTRAAPILTLRNIMKLLR